MYVYIYIYLFIYLLIYLFIYTPNFTSLYQVPRSMRARAKAWFTVWNHLGSPCSGWWHQQRFTCFLRHKSSMIQWCNTVRQTQEKYFSKCKCIQMCWFMLAPLGGCSEALCILKSVTTPMKICGVGSGWAALLLPQKMQNMSWRFPEIGVPLVIIHFNWIFHERNHPAIGDSPCMEPPSWL